MANWWLTVNKDLSFRKALEQEDKDKVIEEVKNICNEVIETCNGIEPKPNHTIDVEYVKEEFEELLEEIKDTEEDGMLEEFEDINYYLDELYDLCNNTRIFIAI